MYVTTRRRFEGIGENHGFSACREYHLVVMNVYWFCYEAIRLWGVNIGVVDKILLNFDRTAGLFHSILYTKLFSVLLLALSCLGTKGVKGEKITWGRIWTAFAVGFVLFFLNWWLLPLRCRLKR